MQSYAEHEVASVWSQYYFELGTQIDHLFHNILCKSGHHNSVIGRGICRVWFSDFRVSSKVVEEVSDHVTKNGRIVRLTYQASLLQQRNFWNKNCDDSLARTK